MSFCVENHFSKGEEFSRRKQEIQIFQGFGLIENCELAGGEKSEDGLNRCLTSQKLSILSR